MRIVLNLSKLSPCYYVTCRFSQCNAVKESIFAKGTSVVMPGARDVRSESLPMLILFCTRDIVLCERGFRGSSGVGSCAWFRHVGTIQNCVQRPQAAQTSATSGEMMG